jgi:hypothetical protein
MEDAPLGKRWSRATFSKRLAAADCWNEKYLAVLSYPVQYAASSHLTVDRHSDRRFDVAIFDQMPRETRELPFKIRNEFTDVATGCAHPIATVGQLTKQGRNDNGCHEQ